jgi:Domain of unknown function (DUF1707)
VASLRASDSDREQVAERLRHATAEGRLRRDELEQRLKALYAAKTYGELDELLADLPANRSVTQRRRLGPLIGAISAVTLVLAILGVLAIMGGRSAAVPALGTGLQRPLKFQGPPPGPRQGLIMPGRFPVPAPGKGFRAPSPSKVRPQVRARV